MTLLNLYPDIRHSGMYMRFCLRLAQCVRFRSVPIPILHIGQMERNETLEGYAFEVQLDTALKHSTSLCMQASGHV